MTATETVEMGKRKKPAPPDTDSAPEGSEKYRKAHKMVRIRIRLAEAAELVADELEQDLTQFVNDAVRERLERAGKWPPKPTPADE